jgi:L-2-hydroxycarboxylate dehydrogenase (NAD+)
MKNETIVYLPVVTIQNFITDAFINLGVPPDEAHLSAEVLIAADLRGIESHGIGRLKYYYDRFKTKQHRPITEFEIVKESPTTALVDGHHGMGMVIGVRSMNMAIEKAQKYGMGSVAVRNSTHFGIAGYYALMAAKKNMAGMTFTNARPCMAPTFGVQPMLGTNPIAFAVPSDHEFPFCYDAATPITQRGKLEVLARAEKPAPEGWTIGQNGEYLTDPNAILQGFANDTAALLPLGGAGELMGGHKGYGLATMVELFSSAFQSGQFMQGVLGFNPDGSRRPFMIGHFFMVINIENFVTIEEFKTTTGKIMRSLQNARKAPGQEKIYVAGEKEYLSEKFVRRQGIAINPNLQKELLYVRRELKLDQYDFPF